MHGFDNLEDIFTLEDARKNGLNSYYLSKYIRKGSLSRISKGIYRKEDSEHFGEWTDFVIASKQIRQRNAICLMSALVYHRLTEHIPTSVWLMVDVTTQTTKPYITLFRKQNPLWSVGIIEDEPLLVTSIERTIVESLAFKDKIGYNESFYALKRSLDKSNPRTDLNKLIKMMEDLGLEKRVMKSLEPWIYE